MVKMWTFFYNWGNVRQTINTYSVSVSQKIVHLGICTLVLLLRLLRPFSTILSITIPHILSGGNSSKCGEFSVFFQKLRNFCGKYFYATHKWPWPLDYSLFNSLYFFIIEIKNGTKLLRAYVVSSASRQFMYDSWSWYALI